MTVLIYPKVCRLISLFKMSAERCEDVQDLVASLGEKIPSDRDYDPAPATSANSTSVRFQ